MPIPIADFHTSPVRRKATVAAAALRRMSPIRLTSMRMGSSCSNLGSNKRPRLTKKIAAKVSRNDKTRASICWVQRGVAKDQPGGESAHGWSQPDSVGQQRHAAQDNQGHQHDEFRAAIVGQAWNRPSRQNCAKPDDGGDKRQSGADQLEVSHPAHRLFRAGEQRRDE